MDTVRYLMTRALFAPSLGYNFAMSKLRPGWRWWDRVDEHVVLGALPLRRYVAAIAGEGVRGVVNTCREFGGHDDLYRRHEIRQLRVPTIDFSPPTREHVEQALEFMRGCRSRGESVYVHCKAGRGRSATVVLCWLITEYGITAKEAQDRLMAIRPQIDKGLWRRQVVQEWAGAKPSGS